MKYILDTNVLVAALISPDKTRPPAVLFRRALMGTIPLLASQALLDEHGRTLQEPSLERHHRLSERGLGDLLGLLGSRSVLVVPVSPARAAPDPKDAHLWALLEHDAASIRITGERALLDSDHFPCRVLTPRAALQRLDEGATG